MTYITSSNLDFDANTVSWVTAQLAITNMNGAQNAWSDNDCYIVNTAAELITPCDYKIPVVPHQGEDFIRDALDSLAKLIHNLIEHNESKVIVHCYAGMERSALTCVWYLVKYNNMSIDDAYELVQKARPIVLDRRSWLKGD